MFLACVVTSGGTQRKWMGFFSESVLGLFSEGEVLLLNYYYFFSSEMGPFRPYSEEDKLCLFGGLLLTSKYNHVHFLYSCFWLIQRRNAIIQ